MSIVWLRKRWRKFFRSFLAAFTRLIAISYASWTAETTSEGVRRISHIFPFSLLLSLFTRVKMGYLSADLWPQEIISWIFVANGNVGLLGLFDFLFARRKCAYIRYYTVIHRRHIRVYVCTFCSSNPTLRAAILHIKHEENAHTRIYWLWILHPPLGEWHACVCVFIFCSSNRNPTRPHSFLHPTCLCGKYMPQRRHHIFSYAPPGRLCRRPAFGMVAAWQK